MFKNILVLLLAVIAGGLAFRYTSGAVFYIGFILVIVLTILAIVTVDKAANTTLNGALLEGVELQVRNDTDGDEPILHFQIRVNGGDYRRFDVAASKLPPEVPAIIDRAIDEGAARNSMFGSETQYAIVL